MKKGGYKIIDFKGIEIGTSSKKIPGIYEAIESTNKRTVVSGLVKSSVEYDDFDALFAVSGSNFTCKAAAGAQFITIVVKPDDTVTVAVGS